MTYDYTKTNKENLTKLRDYLAALPDDYQNLEMSCFAIAEHIAANATPETGCNTPACAVAHGPAAGIRMSKRYCYNTGMYDFARYARDNFINLAGDAGDLFRFAFSGNWPDSLAEVICRLTMIIEERVPGCWRYYSRFVEIEE